MAGRESYAEYLCISKGARKMNRLKNIYVFFFLSLLFLFAGCSMILLYSQIQGYQNLTSRIDTTVNTYTPISYITSKVRSYDAKDKVDVQNIEGINCLVLYDAQATTYIYEKEGSLQELYALKDTKPDLSSGQVILTCEKFEIKKEEDVLRVTTNEEDFVIRLRSGG